MPKLEIDGNIILTFDWNVSEKYWARLSKTISEKYGEMPKKDRVQVEQILLESFQFFVNEFKALIQNEKSFGFFLYTFWLHEESIKLYFKTLKGYKIAQIPEGDFPTYRRILKLILEQGCDIDFEDGGMPEGKQVLEIDQRIEELMYLGYYLYFLADLISYQKMIENAHEIDFEDVKMGIGWQYHYGRASDELFPLLKSDFENGVFDEQASKDLTTAIASSFGIDPQFAFGQIWAIKEHHSPTSTNLQTIQPHILPENLAVNAKISEDIAAIFYGGLTISRANKFTLENVILRPYSLQRHFFRPILVYIINGEQRALIGKEKLNESFIVFATNAVHWGNMYSEWMAIPGMVAFMNKQSLEHDRVLENQIEKIIQEERFPFCRNIKSFKQFSGNNVNIIGKGGPGEIDFIIVNEESKIIFACDTKYNRARYEAVGFRLDYSNFTGHHETQLKRKLDWVSANTHIVQEHLSIIYNKTINLTGYRVQPLFLINTPSFYMFNGIYRAITHNQLRQYLKTEKQFPELEVRYTSGKVEIINHPFFRKPS